MRQLAEQRGWTVVKVYSDRMSGGKADRPGLRELMADARRGAFDVVLVWRFDRFARSIEPLVLALAEFRTLGIDFVSAQEALDTSTPMGKAMFTIVGAMAELERNVIRERIMAGLEHARCHGTKSGVVSVSVPILLAITACRQPCIRFELELWGYCEAQPGRNTLSVALLLRRDELLSPFQTPFDKRLPNVFAGREGKFQIVAIDPFLSMVAHVPTGPCAEVWTTKLAH